MSASKDKLQRKQQIAAGTDKRTAARAKEQAAHRRTTITYSVVALLLVVFFAFVFLYTSAFMTRQLTAVTINGTDYSVAQLNYYYSANYISFYNNNYNYISYGLYFDPSKSLAEQDYPGGGTWRDYFLDAAVQDMTEIQMLNEQAEAAGFTLSEEDQQNYDDEIEYLQTGWQDLGYTNLQQYLNMNYGKGVTMDIVKQEMYRTVVASAYSRSVYDGFEYSDEELADYYAEHADELDVIDFAYYTITPPAEPEEAEDTAEEAEVTEAPEDDADAEEPEATEAPEDAEDTEEPEPLDAQAMADELDGTDEEAFTAYLEEHVGEGTAPTSTSLAGASLNSAYADFLLDEARQPGDVTVAETDSLTYVVMFLGRDTNDYPLVSFRHILAQAEDTDGDGVFSDEEKSAAEAEAQALYDEWQDGDATEDSFAELANANSDDAGSNTTGGLYEDVYKGNMVQPINDWLFDEARQPGDTTVVSYEGSNYTGTHVLYFVGTDEMTFAQRQADDTLRTEAYESWSEEQMAGYEATTSHLNMAGKNH